MSKDDALERIEKALGASHLVRLHSLETFHDEIRSAIKFMRKGDAEETRKSLESMEETIEYSRGSA